MQAAGYNWEIDALDRLVIRGQQRSFESTFLLLPTSTGGIWTSDDVFLTNPDRNFTVFDYRQFFDSIGYAEGALKMDAIREAAGYDFLDREIGVPIHCFYGGGIATPERIVYDSTSAFPDAEPRLELGDGDGTVNRKSLEACHRLRSRNAAVNVKYYHAVGHNEILHHPELISDVLRVAQRNETNTAH